MLQDYSRRTRRRPSATRPGRLSAHHLCSVIDRGAAQSGRSPDNGRCVEVAARLRSHPVRRRIVDRAAGVLEPRTDGESLCGLVGEADHVEASEVRRGSDFALLDQEGPTRLDAHRHACLQDDVLPGLPAEEHIIVVLVGELREKACLIFRRQKNYYRLPDDHRGPDRLEVVG